MDTAMPPRRLLKAHEVAALLNVDRRRVYELPLTRIAVTAKCIRWDPDDVRDFIERRRTQ